MKKINIFYWVFTGLLAALMLLSAIPSLMNIPSAVAMMKTLGYPSYFGRYLAVAKLLGVFAILVPGFPKIKEWAYAGFTFDLIAAVWSLIAIGTPAGQFAFFPVCFIILGGSYIFYHKKMKVKV